MLLVAALFGCLELASTFKVLTWLIMPDVGEADGEAPEDPSFDG